MRYNGRINWCTLQEIRDLIGKYRLDYTLLMVNIEKEGYVSVCSRGDFLTGDISTYSFTSREQLEMWVNDEYLKNFEAMKEKTNPKDFLSRAVIEFVMTHEFCYPTSKEMDALADKAEIKRLNVLTAWEILRLLAMIMEKGREDNKVSTPLKEYAEDYYLEFNGKTISYVVVFHYQKDVGSKESQYYCKIFLKQLEIYSLDLKIDPRTDEVRVETMILRKSPKELEETRLKEILDLVYEEVVFQAKVLGVHFINQ